MDLPYTESQEALGIVVTGGSRGLGYALAREFLLKGDRVIISGRNPEHLEHAVESLKAEIPGCEIYGVCMDVGNPEELDLFTSFIITRLGQVDRWINNAGTSGLRKAPLWQLEASDILETCTTNLAGSMLMSKIATEIMRNQPSEDIPLYHIFNMGFSAPGAKFSRSNIPHKASKLGVAAVSHFLCQELHEQGIRGIGIHELSPGLVKTDLLLRDTSPETKEFLDLIAESPEKVARKLVSKIREANGRKSHIRYRSIAGMGLHALMQLTLKKVGSPLRERILDLSSRKRGDEPL